MTVTTDYNGGDSSAAQTATRRMRVGIQRARRHSRVVRVLKQALPLSFVVMFLSFTASVMKTSGLSSNLPDLNIPKILPENLVMANPHYSGFGKDGSSYSVNAKTARQSLDGSSMITLNEISGLLTGLDKSETNFAAARGAYNQKTGVLELLEKITVAGTAGLSAEMTSATLNTKDGVLTSKEPVRVGMTAGTITANTLLLRHKAHEARFEGDVAAAFVPPKPTKDATAEASSKPAADQDLFGSSDQPLNITAAQLDVKDDANTAVFSGDVRAVQAGQSLTSPELKVVYARKSDDSEAAPSATSAASAGTIQRIEAKGPVVLERGTDDRVTANALAFDAASNVATLTGDVIMRSGADRSAKADRADMNQANGLIMLSGSSVDVQQGRNELHGRRLAINRNQGTAQLTAPPSGGAGPGRIRAKFYSGDANRKAASTATSASDKSSPFTSFKSDPTKPIDIEAESLDVSNGSKTATFRGNVVTVQGDITFKTTEMVAHYAGDVNIADATAPSKPTAGKKSEAELTKIEAKKSVVVTSKEGQSVKGDWATFDAKANTIVVGGEVILSKGGSMVRGSRMSLDLTTGENKIETTPGPTVQQPGGGGWSTSGPENAEAASQGNRGRPSAVFFPADMDKDKNKSTKKPTSSAPQTGKPSNGDAWSAQTAPAANDPLQQP